MKYFQNKSIRTKLKLVILSTSIITIILVFAGFFIYEHITYKSILVNDLATKAEIIAENSNAALAFRDSTDAGLILNSLASQPHVIAGAIYDIDGRMFASYARRNQLVQFPGRPESESWQFRDDDLVLFKPITVNGKQIGTIYLSMDLGRRDERFRSYIQIALGVLIGSLAVAFLIATLLARNISAPIMSLADTAREVSNRQDFAIRASKSTNDETGFLADSFNQMLEQIQERTSEVARSNESLRKNENQLQTIVENLAEGLVVSDLHGQLLHFNRAALDLHGYASLDECRRHLTEFADTFELAGMDGTVWPVQEWPLARVLRGESLQELEVRIRRITQPTWLKIFSYGGTLVHDTDGQPMMAVVTINDITERKRVEEEIRKLNAELERRVFERTAQLEVANKELEAFSYSVSHDLRAPLRSIDGFSQALLEDYHDKLGEQGKDFLSRVRASSQRMAQLIDDLLNLSRVTRAEMRLETVDLSEMARTIAYDLQKSQPDRVVKLQIADGVTARGDTRLLRVMLDNLLSNAWKYTSKHQQACVDFGAIRNNGEAVYFVRDDGAGFDMAFVDKLFGAFQRLHGMAEFPGTGIGLATVQRIVHRHGGKVWAEAKVEEGATFYFTLS